jgi:hypothetical protein
MAVKRAASTDSTQRTIYLTGQDDQWLDAMSRRWTSSRSGVIKRLISFYISHKPPKQAVKP